MTAKNDHLPIGDLLDTFPNEAVAPSYRLESPALGDPGLVPRSPDTWTHAQRESLRQAVMRESWHPDLGASWALSDDWQKARRRLAQTPPPWLGMVTADLLAEDEYLALGTRNFPRAVLEEIPLHHLASRLHYAAPSLVLASDRVARAWHAMGQPSCGGRAPRINPPAATQGEMSCTGYPRNWAARVRLAAAHPKRAFQLLPALPGLEVGLTGPGQRRLLIRIEIGSRHAEQVLSLGNKKDLLRLTRFLHAYHWMLRELLASGVQTAIDTPTGARPGHPVLAALITDPTQRFFRSGFCLEHESDVTPAYKRHLIPLPVPTNLGRPARKRLVAAMLKQAIDQTSGSTAARQVKRMLEATHLAEDWFLRRLRRTQQERELAEQSARTEAIAEIEADPDLAAFIEIERREGEPERFHVYRHDTCQRQYLLSTTDGAFALGVLRDNQVDKAHRISLGIAFGTPYAV